MATAKKVEETSIATDKKIAKTDTRVEEVHTLINSGLDKRIAAEVANALLQGREEGRKIAVNERVERVAESERVEDRQTGKHKPGGRKANVPR